MRKIDIRSLIIGVLLTVIFFLLTGQTTSKINYDKLTVKDLFINGRISVIDGKGSYISIEPNQLTIRDKLNSLILNSTTIDMGAISMYGLDNPKMGWIKLKGKDNFTTVEISSFGPDINGGYIALNNVADVDKTKPTNPNISLHAFEEFSAIELKDGLLNIKNKYDTTVVSIQCNRDNDGSILLFDRYGDYGWGVTGKK